MSEKFLKLPAVAERTGLSRSSIYAYIKEGRFPAPVKIGLRGVAWPESVLNQWMNECKHQEVQNV